MIKPGDIIKHKAFLDVAILILFSSEHPETKDLEIKGVWLNQGQKTSYVINSNKYPTGIPITLNLSTLQIKNWLVCSKPEAKFIRNEEWK